jgi:hypothetical protein
MMGVSGAPPADQTGLRRHEFEVRFVAMPTRLADRELAFFDFEGRSIGLNVNRSRRPLVNGRLQQDRRYRRFGVRGFDFSEAPPWSRRLDGRNC